MMSSVCNYGTMSARFNVCADSVARKITVEVRAYGLGDCIDEVYPAEKYGEALDRYRAICEEMKQRHEAA